MVQTLQVGRALPGQSEAWCGAKNKRGFIRKLRKIKSGYKTKRSCIKVWCKHVDNTLLAKEIWF